MRTNPELQREILNELHSDPELGSSSAEIGVSVQDGTVTLSGQVNSFAKKEAAERAARRVKGVKVVALDIEVVLPGRKSHTDTALARSVNQALRWHMAVEEERIQVRVEDGWVFLEGDVDWDYQKVLAEEALENIRGIKGVINLIRVDYSVLQAILKESTAHESFFNNFTANDCETKMETTLENIAVRNKEEAKPSINEEKEEKEIRKKNGFASVENRYIKSRNKKRFGYNSLSSPFSKQKRKGI